LIGESLSIHVFGLIRGWNADFELSVHDFGVFYGWIDAGTVKGPMKGAWGRRSSLWRCFQLEGLPANVAFSLRRAVVRLRLNRFPFVASLSQNTGIPSGPPSSWPPFNAPLYCPQPPSPSLIFTVPSDGGTYEKRQNRWRRRFTMRFAALLVYENGL
jgi:hypothetical protein